MSRLESLVNEINRSINNHNDAIDKGNSPIEFKDLEEKIQQFTLEIAKLDDESKKQYIDVLGVWSNQIREISQKINDKMNEIKGNIEGANNQSKAIKGYSYLKQSNDN